MVLKSRMRSKWGCVLPHSSLVQPNKFFCQRRLSEELIFLLEWNNSFCLFWTLIIKKKNIVEENNRKKSGQQRPLEVIQSLLYTELRTTGLQGSFLLGSQWARTETVPSAWQPLPQLRGCSICSCSPSPGQTPSPCLFLMAGICISCLHENKCYFTHQKFSPKWQRKMFNKNIKVTFSMLSKIKWHIIPELLTISVRLLYFQVLSQHTQGYFSHIALAHVRSPSQLVQTKSRAPGAAQGVKKQKTKTKKPKIQNILPFHWGTGAGSSCSESLGAWGWPSPSLQLPVAAAFGESIVVLVALKEQWELSSCHSCCNLAQQRSECEQWHTTDCPSLRWLLLSEEPVHLSGIFFGSV